MSIISFASSFFNFLIVIGLSSTESNYPEYYAISLPQLGFGKRSIELYSWPNFESGKRAISLPAFGFGKRIKEHYISLPQLSFGKRLQIPISYPQFGFGKRKEGKSSPPHIDRENLHIKEIVSPQLGFAKKSEAGHVVNEKLPPKGENQKMRRKIVGILVSNSKDKSNEWLYDLFYNNW